MRRALLGVLIALAVLVPLSVGPVMADTPAAQCTKNSNDHFGIAAPWDGACWAGAFQNITHFAGDTVATSVTRWVMSAAVETTDLMLGQFSGGGTTRPVFGTPWFDKIYYGNVTHTFSGVGTTYPGQPGALGIAEMLAVPLVVLTVIAGVVRGDVGGAIKTVVVRLPLIVILCFGFVAVLSRTFDVVDALSRWVIGSTVSDFQSWTSRFDPSNIGADFAVVIVGIVIILATLIAYIELFVRSAMIYLVVAFVPLIAVATLWQGSRTALKKTVELLGILTLSKLVMAFAFMIGAGALTAGDAGNFAPLLVGAVIFCIVAFAPFTLFALIPIMEVAAVGAVAGMGARFGANAARGTGRHGPGLAGGAARTAAHVPGAGVSGVTRVAASMVPVGNRVRSLVGVSPRGKPTGPGSQLQVAGAPAASPSGPASNGRTPPTPTPPAPNASARPQPPPPGEGGAND